MNAKANEDFGLPPVTGLDEVAALEAELAALKAKSRAKELRAQIAAEQVKVDEVIPPADNNGWPKEYVKLEVFKGGNPEDPEFVTPGIGGFNIKIQRGEKVIVHKCIMSVLANAVETKMIPHDGGMTLRDAPRFPFTVYGPATEDEYLTFQGKMRDQAVRAAAPAA